MQTVQRQIGRLEFTTFFTRSCLQIALGTRLATKRTFEKTLARAKERVSRLLHRLKHWGTHLAGEVHQSLALFLEALYHLMWLLDLPLLELQPGF